MTLIIVMNKTMAHKNRPLCRFEGGCTNQARKGGVCVTHGANVKRCSFEGGCTNQAVKDGLCITHGKRCNFKGGCTNQAIKGGVCETHGATKARKRCNFKGGCNKHAVKGGVCITHGATKAHKRCNFKGGCTNQAIVGGVCSRHGATKARKCKQCSVEGGCDNNGAIVKPRRCNNNAVKPRRCNNNADYATATINATVATSMIVDCDITIDQNGENKLHKASNNEFSIINKYNPSLYCWSSLPSHPNPAMVDTSVLSTHLAELVTEQLHLPSNPDTSKMYLFKVNTVQDDDSTTFVNVIYYTSNTVDNLTASDAGKHTTTIFDYTFTTFKSQTKSE